jgi:hypothetical protein
VSVSVSESVSVSVSVSESMSVSVYVSVSVTAPAASLRRCLPHQLLRRRQRHAKLPNKANSRQSQAPSKGGEHTGVENHSASERSRGVIQKESSHIESDSIPDSEDEGSGSVKEEA